MPADELLNGYYVPVDVRRYGIDPVVVEHGDPGGSYLAAERAPANAAVQLSRHGVARFLPDGVYRRSRRIAKFGKRFLRRHIV